MASTRPGGEGFVEGHGLRRELLDDCVHCGFCLPACPTYQLWGQEADSPRGRIHLMRAGLDGAPLTPTMVARFDACLGCQACVSACPSGVQYESLLEGTRVQVEALHSRPLAERLLRTLLFTVFPHPARLRLLLPLLRWYQRSGLAVAVRRSRWIARALPRLAAMERLLPDVPDRLPALAAHTPAHGPLRARVGVLTGCVQRVFFPGVNAATVRVLAAEGCDVSAPPAQSCCGALSVHLGREEEAKAMARRTIQRWEEDGAEWIVVNAAGCGSAMKRYGELLAGDPAWEPRARAFAARVRDAGELLAELGSVAPRGALNGSIAYQDACHLAHAQGIRRQPRDLLAEIPGLEVRPVADAELCCGSAGVYNILQPDAAGQLGARKTQAVLATGAAAVASANPGCIMQLRRGMADAGEERPVLHLMEVLDASIRAAGFEGLLSGEVPLD